MILQQSVFQLVRIGCGSAFHLDMKYKLLHKTMAQGACEACENCKVL